MLFSKAVVGASFLLAVFSAVSSIPQPGIIRERHIIHTPIKYKIIHHYNIKKVPILIKKHVHFYKPQEETHHLSIPPTLDEGADNQIYQNDHEEGHWDHPHGREEDYDENEQSQEENDDYEDYEYE